MGWPKFFSRSKPSVQKNNDEQELSSTNEDTSEEISSDHSAAALCTGPALQPGIGRSNEPGINVSNVSYISHGNLSLSPNAPRTNPMVYFPTSMQIGYSALPVNEYFTYVIRAKDAEIVKLMERNRMLQKEKEYYDHKCAETCRLNHELQLRLTASPNAQRSDIWRRASTDSARPLLTPTNYENSGGISVVRTYASVVAEGGDDKGLADHSHGAAGTTNSNVADEKVALERELEHRERELAERDAECAALYVQLSTMQNDRGAQSPIISGSNNNYENDGKSSEFGTRDGKSVKTLGVISTSTPLKVASIAVAIDDNVMGEVKEAGASGAPPPNPLENIDVTPIGKLVTTTQWQDNNFTSDELVRIWQNARKLAAHLRKDDANAIAMTRMLNCVSRGKMPSVDDLHCTNFDDLDSDYDESNEEDLGDDDDCFGSDKKVDEPRVEVCERPNVSNIESMLSRLIASSKKRLLLWGMMHQKLLICIGSDLLANNKPPQHGSDTSLSVVGISTAPGGGKITGGCNSARGNNNNRAEQFVMDNSSSVSGGRDFGSGDARRVGQRG